MGDVDRDPRREAILDSARATFASKGFDGASMQDLARGAGMSAGNFYRYFPSKSALIEALVEREIACVGGAFAEVMVAEDPLDAFRRLVREEISGGHVEHGQIWAEIEAAAARRPDFDALIQRMETEVIRNLVALFARIADLPEAEAAARFGGEARLLLVLVHGASMRCGARDADPQLSVVVLRTIDHILSEIAGARRSLVSSLSR